ncbi:MAG: CoA-binding protein [Chloroflexota bacterium]
MSDVKLIRKILRESKNIAVVGLSNDETRPSFRVARYLQGQGYRIIPINPSVDSVLGEKSYPDLASVSEQIDVVDVFRRPEHVPPIAEAAIKKGAHTLWLQDGVGNPEAEYLARQAGLQVVANDCMQREHRRLRATGSL